MSQNIRADPASEGRHGSAAKVLGSGIAIMSDSSIALKPVIEDPSKPIPPSNASANSLALIENAFSCPMMSVNHSRMNLMSLSAASEMTSSAVNGRSDIGVERYLHGKTAFPARALRSAGGGVPSASSDARGDLPGAEPAPSPALDLDQCRPEFATHPRKLVFDPERRPGDHRPLDDAPRFKLLHPLG